MKELKTRAVKAASTYLDHRGYTVLEVGWRSEAGTADVIAEDGDALVFVKVRARSGAEAGFPAERHSASERAVRERVVMTYLAQHDAVDIPIRFDDVSLVAISPDRAMIRHHINSLCADIELPEEALPEVA
ncbi:hypothetical protein C1878_00035 [Gordonibacter sp. 28C]|uniref:YraN family protein n=1 Tax=Gordonibacter sp. 28C TaxID=2078569 RepID=UPI000DF74BD3|nr:YraN family protein [Gordonibacter sp. 28C]RDB64298.1 hypothetical protein C1878_00035 [Gordonibacter sp. 28C]